MYLSFFPMVVSIGIVYRLGSTAINSDSIIQSLSIAFASHVIIFLPKFGRDR